MQYVELLGFLAGFVSTISFFPQVLKVWKSGSTQGISLGMYIIYLLGLFLWVVYAWLIESHSLLITEAVTAFLVAYILVRKIRQRQAKEI